MENSLLVNISVHGAGMFHTGITLEEMGIDSARTADRVKGGRRILDPELDKMANSWATQCRQLNNKHMVKLEAVDALTGSTSWYVLMLDRFDRFKADWDELTAFNRELEDEYFAYRNLIRVEQLVSDSTNLNTIAYYESVMAGIYGGMSTRQKIITKFKARADKIRQENIDFIENLAERNWRGIQARYLGGVALSVKYRTFGQDDRLEYIEWCVEQVMEEIPSAAYIEEKLHAEYTTSVLFSRTQFEQDKAQRAEAELQPVQAQAEMQDIVTNRFLTEERKKAIRQAELEKARRALENSISPIQEAMQKLLKTLQESIEGLLNGYSKHGTFKGRSLETARGFTDLYEIMGGRLFGDETLGKLIDDLKGKCEPSTAGDNKARQSAIVSDLHKMQAYVVSQLPRNKSRARYLKL